MRSKHTWIVDAGKLQGNDRSIVSRGFVLTFVGDDRPDSRTFKLILNAKVVQRAGKGGQSFKLSQGQGSIHLKCERDLRAMAEHALFDVCFSRASGDSCGGGPPENNVRHNFAHSAACVSCDWDFSQMVDQDTQTFAIAVKITPASCLAVGIPR